MFGGGGDSSGQILQNQRDQESQKEKGRALINRIFGVGAQGAPLPEPNQQNYYKTVESGPDGDPTRVPDVDAYNRAYQDYLDSQVSPDVAGNAAARDASYDRVRQATLDYNRNKLDTDREPAERQLRFALLRSGNSGGSLDIDQNNLLQRKYDQGILDSTNAADAAALGARSSDEKARLDLLSRINSGLDQGSAIAGASQQLQTSADNAIANAKGSVIGNVFDNAGLLYQAQQKGEGGSDAMARYFQSRRPSSVVPTIGGTSATGTLVRNP